MSEREYSNEYLQKQMNICMRAKKSLAGRMDRVFQGNLSHNGIDIYLNEEKILSVVSKNINIDDLNYIMIAANNYKDALQEIVNLQTELKIKTEDLTSDNKTLKSKLLKLKQDVIAAYFQLDNALMQSEDK